MTRHLALGRGAPSGQIGTAALRRPEDSANAVHLLNSAVQCGSLLRLAVYEL